MATLAVRPMPGTELARPPRFADPARPGGTGPRALAIATRGSWSAGGASQIGTPLRTAGPESAARADR